MKDKLYKALVFIPMIALLATPVLGLAQADNPISENPPIQNLDDATSLLEKILTWFNTIFWIAAAFFVLLAAFKYLTAQGDEEKVGEAKNMLIYAVIAIVVALFAGGIDTLIANVLQTGV
ncbi:MAG TPA: hypothetical protein VKO61_01700 [Candidatus Paceibacterota bacterium]|nr:hypothetical protein [Candidatus Paceibacterota bacterium]